MSKGGAVLCALVLLHLFLDAGCSWPTTGGPAGDRVFLCQDRIARSSRLMLSRGLDGFDGARLADDDMADAIFHGHKLTDGHLLVGGSDEYASDDDDGGTPLPLAEADAEEEDDLSPWAADDHDGVGKDSSAELGSGGDVACPICRKFFKNEKAVFGHLRSHPNRGNKGATPPEKKLKLTNDPGSSLASSSLSPNIDGSSTGHQSSGRDPELTPFERLCACFLLLIRSRDDAQQAARRQAPPLSRSFVSEGKLDAVDEETDDAGIGGLVPGNAAVQVKSEDPLPDEDTGNGFLLCDDRLDGDSIVKPPKKRRRVASKEDGGEPSRKVIKLAKPAKEKRPYVCKHCQAEFPTHQALGGHMAGHHRDKKAPAALSPNDASVEHQGAAVQSQNTGKQAKGGDDPSRAGLSLSSRRMQVEQLSMAPNMGWLSGQVPGGKLKLHFIRRNNGTPLVATPAAVVDGDRRRPLNIDLNADAPEQ